MRRAAGELRREELQELLHYRVRVLWRDEANKEEKKI